MFLNQDSFTSMNEYEEIVPRFLADSRMEKPSRRSRSKTQALLFRDLFRRT
jgi:hypothetical protein